jgi:hypothetical protein
VTLEEGERSASHPGNFTLNEKAPSTYGVRTECTEEPIWVLWKREKCLVCAGSLAAQSLAHNCTEISWSPHSMLTNDNGFECGYKNTACTEINAPYTELLKLRACMYNVK